MDADNVIESSLTMSVIQNSSIFFPGSFEELQDT